MDDFISPENCPLYAPLQIGHKSDKGARMDGSMIRLHYATISGPRSHMLSMARVKGARKGPNGPLENAR